MAQVPALAARLGLLRALSFQAESCAGSSSASSFLIGARRALGSEAPLDGRYSPNQFGRQKPADTSLLWMRKNPYVEALYWRRDHLEREFSWTSRNTFELTYFIGGITALFYGLSVFGLRSADRQSGYPQRNILFHPTNNAFVNPDEREFY